MPKKKTEPVVTTNVEEFNSETAIVNRIEQPIASLTGYSFVSESLKNQSNRIYSLTQGMARNLLAIAVIVNDVNETGDYKQDFESVQDWTATVFGYKKTQTYNLIRIGKEYVTRGLIPDSPNTGIEVCRTNLIETEDLLAPDFNATQLEKLLPLGHDKAKELVDNGIITLDMSAKKIADIVKLYTKKYNKTESIDETEENTEETNESDTEIIEQEPAKNTDIGKFTISEISQNEFDFFEITINAENLDTIEAIIALLKK